MVGGDVVDGHGGGLLQGLMDDVGSWRHWGVGGR